MTETSEERGAALPVRENASWLRTLRRYMAFVAGANLVWEFAHMPLYTLWETGTRGEIIFAALHCMGGDVLIALSALMLALFLVGAPAWPMTSGRRVVALTLAFGLAYTLFSEWLNIEVREAWAYRDVMPVIPLIDAGLSPVLQWIAVPLAAFWWAMRPVSNVEANSCGMGECDRPSRPSLDTESASFALDQPRN